MRRNADKYTFGTAGIIISFLCLVVLCGIELYGPGSYTSTGSGQLYADGTIVVIQESLPVLPRIARAAFYLCFLSLPLGIMSYVRKEAIIVSAGAMVFGIAPILVYTVGVTTSLLLYSSVLVLIVGVVTCRYVEGRDDKEPVDIE